MIFNVNNAVEVRLTQAGRDYLRQEHKQFWTSHGKPDYPYTAPKEDAEGWSRWQLWSLMEKLGPLMYLGNPHPPIDMEIRIPDEQRSKT